MTSKSYIQKKYAETLCSRLSNCTIRKHSPFLANFRCEVCGDSSKNRFKKRGYLIERDGSFFYYCHNGCGSSSLDSHLKNHHPDLYQQYRFDLLMERDDKPFNLGDFAVNSKKETAIIDSAVMRNLINVTNLPSGHPAIKYLMDRKIPLDKFQRFFYTETFFKFVNGVVADKFPDLKGDHPRLVMPMCDFNGKLFGVVGRAIDSNPMRYYTIKFDEDSPRFYGLDTVDRNLKVYITEGPIDSLFLPNSVALTSTDGQFDLFKNFTIILDNQPRNREVVGSYDKYISKGYNIVIWPDSIREKDINDMILGGKSQEDVVELVRKNTFNGLNAQIKFRSWKKI